MAKKRTKTSSLVPFVSIATGGILLTGIAFSGIMNARVSRDFLSGYAQAAASDIAGFAIASDSSSDEYRADDFRAGNSPYAQTTLSWVELLAKYRGVDVGTWGCRAEPRRCGYEYNWARSAARARDLVNNGQHTGIAAQVRAGLVDIVYLQIGNNDFAYWADGGKIYAGEITGAALDRKIDDYVSNVRTAFQTIADAKPRLIIVGNVPDPNAAPTIRLSHPDANGRARVSAAVAKANAGLASLANSPGVVYFDQESFANTLLSKADASGNLLVGGEKIRLTTYGDEPHNIQLADKIHGGTVMEGLFANAVIEKINQGLGASTITPFGDREILGAAGIGAMPTAVPTTIPTAVPTARPTSTPATPLPTPPTMSPRPTPTRPPTPTPRPLPTPTPSLRPSVLPSIRPTQVPATPLPPVIGQEAVVEIKNVGSLFRSGFVLDGIVEDGGGQIDASSPKFNYTGTWTKRSGVGKDRSDVFYSTKKGSTVRFTTTARELEILTGKYRTEGKIDVYVNGKLYGRYDLYSSSVTLHSLRLRLR